MITRRRAITGTLSAAMLASTASSGVATLAQAATDELIALPGKKPLIKRTFRPPNYETPLADLRDAFTSNEAFFVRYHLALIPQIDPSSWKLRIGGASTKRSLELSLEDLQTSFERVSIAAVNQCSGNRRGLFRPRVPGVQWGDGAIGNALWTGVRLRDVLRKVGMRETALEVVFDGADSALLSETPDFVKSLPVDRALDENTLIAFEMNGRPLPHWHGAPARLVVPGWTATYWIKHLTAIRAEPAAFNGFWMSSGYRIPTGALPGSRFRSQETTETTPITEILVNSLVTSHATGTRIARGVASDLTGWAWDSGSGIARVEVSRDSGNSWVPAKLEKDLGRFAWRGFRLPLDTSRVGRLDLMVRAADRAGSKQPLRLVLNPSGYHHNAIRTLALDVV